MARYGSTDLGKGTQDPEHVTQLQRDLNTLGFAIVGTPDGNFGRKTFWALREFQSYAKYETVAHLTGNSGSQFERLEPVATGANRYQGQVDGVANTDTRLLLEHWINADWRCPVMINAWNVGPGLKKKSLKAQNVWAHDDCKVSSSDVAFFAHDLSGHFPDAGALPDGTVLLGRYTSTMKGGPLSTPPNYTQPASEMMPDNLVGRPFNQLNPPEQSTFRVLRAVAEVECYGFFDCINAYDRALVSVGPCHWTLGLVVTKNDVAQIYKGELCGTLAYAAWNPNSQRDFDSYFTFFGVNVCDSWVDSHGVPNGKRLYDPTQRKYPSWLSFVDATGHYSAVPIAEEDGNYFKSWHWIYRFTAALRGSRGLRSSFWDMARVRLRDVGAIQVNVAGTQRRVDEVFTSERARALLHRWHIYKPDNIASSSGPGRALVAIVRAATRTSVPGGWATGPATWTNAHEAALNRAIDQTIQQLGNANLKDTTSYVSTWPSWTNGPNPRKYRLSVGLAPLSAARGSFAFDMTGLPPAP